MTGEHGATFDVVGLGVGAMGERRLMRALGGEEIPGACQDLW